MPATTLSYSDTDGQHMVVLDHASTSIGRSPGQDIVLRDAAASRQHAVIVIEDGLRSIAVMSWIKTALAALS